jgi:hypothetical protein
MRLEPIPVLAKAMGLGWDDARALLLLRSGHKDGSADDHDLCGARFHRPRLETALKTIQFYRLRERAASAGLSWVICTYRADAQSLCRLPRAARGHRKVLPLSDQ